MYFYVYQSHNIQKKLFRYVMKYVHIFGLGIIIIAICLICMMCLKSNMFTKIRESFEESFSVRDISFYNIHHIVSPELNNGNLNGYTMKIYTNMSGDSPVYTGNIGRSRYADGKFKYSDPSNELINKIVFEQGDEKVTYSIDDPDWQRDTDGNNCTWIDRIAPGRRCQNDVKDENGILANVLRVHYGM